MKLSSDARIDLAVAASAVVVYIGTLWNGFALDDVEIIAANPLVHSLKFSGRRS